MLSWLGLPSSLAGQKAIKLTLKCAVSVAQLSRKQNRFMTGKRQQRQRQTVNGFAVMHRATAHTQAARQKKNTWPVGSARLVDTA